jgi:hypothetical protein
MKKLSLYQLQRLYTFCLAVAVISMVVFIALTWRRELEFPVIPALLPLFVIAVIVLSKRVKRKKEEASSNEK